MMNHSPRILFVEDKVEFYNPIKRWLGDAGYQVFHHQNKKGALEALENNTFHLAILDVRLEDEDETNSDGMDLVHYIHETGLISYMGVIVLTAYGDLDQALKALTKYSVDQYIQKAPGYRRELLNTLKHLLEERVKINFNLNCHHSEADLMDQIVREILLSEKIKVEESILLVELHDLLGKLFYVIEADEVELQKMRQGLSGASIVMARPKKGNKNLRPFVLKINRRDKTTVEEDNYGQHVDPYLSPNRRAKLDHTAYTYHLGMLCYSFAESDGQAMQEFDQIFVNTPLNVLVDSFYTLIKVTCDNWYGAINDSSETIKSLYFKAFELDETLLVSRAREFLPDFEPGAATLSLNGHKEVTNPVAWINSSSTSGQARTCITHGDFNARNILVDTESRYWLIDFYRTTESHILRDFVILETDLAYHLMPDMEDHEFVNLYKKLIDGELATVEVVDPLLSKGVAFIDSIRRLGIELIGGDERQEEYFWSLLMATLNVVRLKHIPHNRKRQALLSAAILCDYIDTLPN